MLERYCWFANIHRHADVLGQKRGTLPLGALFSERKSEMKTTEDPRPWCGIVPVVYEGLSNFSKKFSRYNFSLEHCSLVEYIGVEWAMRVPLSEHRAYMTTIFERLAMAGNDEAAHDAFLLIATEIIPMTEFQLRASPYINQHPHKEERKKLEEELHSEVLEFIRTHFWTMPIKPGDMRGWDKVLHTKPDRKEEFLLLKTRQEMARQCMRNWGGIPGNKCDELAFCMLAEMLCPQTEGVCVYPEGFFDAEHSFPVLSYDFLCRKEMIKAACDALRQDNLTYTYASVLSDKAWLHWLTAHRNVNPLLLETLAKTRARHIGHEGVIKDLEARLGIEQKM